MEINDALSFLFQRADATQTFWNFYITIATALLTFLAAGKTQWINKKVCAVLTVGFLVFAFANFGAVDQVRGQRAALISLIPKLDSYDPCFKAVIESTKPPTASDLKLFHGTLDGIVVALIWIIPYIRQRNASTVNKSQQASAGRTKAG